MATVRVSTKTDITTTYEAVVTLGAFIVSAKILSMVAQSIITDLVMTVVLAYMCKLFAPQNKALNSEWDAKVRKNAEWCDKLMDTVNLDRPILRRSTAEVRMTSSSSSSDSGEFATKPLPSPTPFVFPSLTDKGIVIMEPESEDEASTPVEPKPTEAEEPKPTEVPPPLATISTGIYHSYMEAYQKIVLKA
jgi:hypothetical protein